MDNMQYQRYMITSRSLITLVNGILATSFFSRGLYQLLSMFDILKLPNIPLQVKDNFENFPSYPNVVFFCLFQNDEDVSIAIVICFAVWDYIPVILLLLTVTSRAIGNNANSNSILKGNQPPKKKERKSSGIKRRKSFVNDDR